MSLTVRQDPDGSILISRRHAGSWSITEDDDWGIKVEGLGSTKIPLVPDLVSRQDVIDRQRARLSMTAAVPAVPAPGTPAYTNIRRIVSEARSETNRNQSVIVNLSDLDALLDQIDGLQQPTRAVGPAPSVDFLRSIQEALCEQVDWSNNGEKTALAILAAIQEKRIPGLCVSVGPAKPVPMLLWCPMCHARHIDEGEFATKSHHTHACQSCGMAWRPADVPTVGVQFIPGFKNDAAKENT